MGAHGSWLMAHAMAQWAVQGSSGQSWAHSRWQHEQGHSTEACEATGRPILSPTVAPLVGIWPCRDLGRAMVAPVVGSVGDVDLVPCSL